MSFFKYAKTISARAKHTGKFNKNLTVFYSILLYFTVFYTFCDILKKMLSIADFII